MEAKEQKQKRNNLELLALVAVNQCSIFGVRLTHQTKRTYWFVAEGIKIGIPKKTLKQLSAKG